MCGSVSLQSYPFGKTPMFCCCKLRNVQRKATLVSGHMVGNVWTLQASSWKFLQLRGRKKFFVFLYKVTKELVWDD